MSEIEDLCKRIERLDNDSDDNRSNLYITLQLQSTTHCIIRKLEEHQDYRRLVDLIKDPDNEAKLFSRASFIWKMPFDTRYENPNDTFLAVYLYVLSTVEDHNDRIWSLVYEISNSKTVHFFYSKCIAQALVDKRYGDAMRVTERSVIRVRCRVCGGLFLDNEVATYTYTSRYVGDGSTSAPKLFSLCRDCLQRGLDTLEGKK